MANETKAQKTVKSEERSTGMGATRFTAILQDGAWIRVSEYSGNEYHGRFAGVHEHSVIVPADTVTADFYRSNSGREEISICDGEVIVTVYSFEDANRWAARAGGAK